MADTPSQTAALPECGDALVALDTSLRVLAWSEGAEQMYGWREAEVLGRRYLDVVATVFADGQRAEMVQQLTGGGRWQGQVFQAHKCGAVLQVEARIRIMRDTHGATVGWVMIFRDLGACRRAERHRLQVRKMQALGRLAGGVAHDFNNVLTVVLSHAEMLEMREDVTPAARAHVAQIQRAAERAGQLTKRLLTIGRRRRLRQGPLQLAPILEEVQEQLSSLFVDCTLRLSIDTSLPLVRGESGVLLQILTNLLMNAREAIPPGGRVLLTARAQVLSSPLDGYPDVVELGQYAVIEVRDTGCGIDSDTLECVFEPFFSTKGARGSGLGLAMVHALTEQLCGAVQVQSVRDEGSSFSVYLPVWED